MKRIVFSIMTVAAMLLAACNQGNNSGSQQNRGPGDFNVEERVNNQIEDLDELLDLTKSQETQMHDVLMETMEKMLQAREDMRNSGAGFEGMREKMQEIGQEQNGKIKEILTEEQWPKYEEYEKERRSRRGQGRQGGGQGRPE